MKSLKTVIGVLLLGSVLAVPAMLLAAEHEHHSAQPEQKGAKLKPYTLKTCIVSGDKLGGDMGEPFVHKYQDREIKFCCKSCLKDFNKEPAKFIKKIEEAEKKAKK